MTILRDLSLVWSMIHVLVLFIFFYESRYSRKKTIMLTIIFMVPLIILNIAGVIIYGPELVSQLMVLTCTVPSAILFFIIAKNRNWKFFFTFCVVDTLSYEIIVVTRLIDCYIFGDKYIAMFILRLVAFPLMEWLGYRYLRKPFLEMKNQIKSGWGIFTMVTVIYYALLLVSVSFPTLIVYRTEYVPAMLLILSIMPITYTGIFLTLRNQIKYVDMENRDRILELQASALVQRIEEITLLEDKIKIQQHDVRHRYSVISEMLNAGENEEALRYINETQEVLSGINNKEYCSNAAINAVFGYFVSKAEQNGIKTDIQVSIPKDCEFSMTELSVVIANSFENAVNACMELPEGGRFIECRSVSTPQFIFRMSNPFNGKVSFDGDGLPMTDKSGHGIGIHSVKAFCEKNDIFYEYKVEDGLFVFSMLK